MHQKTGHGAPISALLDYGVLGGLILLCLAVGYLGSLATTPNLDPWYATLAKPPWTPPPMVFPIVWTVLYLAMATAVWLVWRSRGDAGARRLAVTAFFLQLALNAAWSWAFFAARSPALGLVVIVALLAALLWTVRTFLAVSRPAAGMMVPYLAWVGFAAALNAAILAMNFPVAGASMNG